MTTTDASRTPVPAGASDLSPKLPLNAGANKSEIGVDTEKVLIRWIHAGGDSFYQWLAINHVENIRGLEGHAQMLPAMFRPHDGARLNWVPGRIDVKDDGAEPLRRPNRSQPW